jgi:hypothetical protein
MAASGEIERLPPPRLSARYVIRQETLAGASGNGRDAPIPVIRPRQTEFVKPTQTGNAT